MSLPDDSTAPDLEAAIEAAQARQDQPEQESTPEPPEAAPEQTEDKADADEQTVDFFDEKFDPAQLDDALRPAYKQMQGRFTQRMQEVAEQRQEIEQNAQLLHLLQSEDPEEQAVALHALGFDVDIPSDEDDEVYDDAEGYEDNDELAALKQELAEIREWRDSQTQQTEAAQFEQAVNEFMDESWDTLKSQTGRDDFTEKEVEVLEKLAVANSDEDGLPSLQNAYEELYGEVLPEVRQRWVKSKDAPRVSTTGSSATQVPDLDDPRALNDHIAMRVEQIQAQEAGHSGA